MFSSGEATTSGKNKTNGTVTGTAYETVPDWQQIGTFVAGLGLGAAIGAAAALLWAPRSGEEIRGKIRQRFSRGGDESLWNSLGEELKRAAAKRKPIDEEEIEELEEVEIVVDD